jgi:long-chain fatty acid transport protein
MRFSRTILMWGLMLVAASSFPPDARGQGAVLPGVGPVNRSMAGATVGAPLDAAGAMHWNPAAIAGLEESEIMFGAEFLYARTDVSSTFPGFGSGSDESASGIAVLPASAIVYQPDGSPLTLGFGVYTIGGFSANYPANPGNPIFSPPPPFGVGLGAVYSELALIQYVPTAAIWLTDRFSVGFAPTFTMASLSIDPGLFAAPDDADLSGFPTYPSGTHSRWHWGVGFQVGMYYETEGPWSFGLSFKSPQWFETFEFRATDEIGNPRRLEVDVDYPMILSGGFGMRPYDSLLWATDVRYIDYENTDGFGSPAGFAPDLSVTGLGWRSVVSVATGVHYELNPCTSLRVGYLFNENPIPASAALINIASPPIFQHAVFLGASRRVTQSIGVSLSYLHAFENDIQGPYVTPFGAVPGASVGIKQETDALTMAIQVFF